MLVDSGILASLESSKYVPLIPFLCASGEQFGLRGSLYTHLVSRVAFSGHNLTSGDSASRVLFHLWSGNFPEINNFVSLVFSALISLGASPAILEGLGWTTSAASNAYVSAGDRIVAINRFVSLLQMACW
jgi:hypothetical protein